MMISVFDWVENIVRKGEDAVYQHFSFSHNVFKKFLPHGHWNSELCGKELIL